MSDLKNALKMLKVAQRDFQTMEALIASPKAFDTEFAVEFRYEPEFMENQAFERNELLRSVESFLQHVSRVINQKL